jgi:hypothetical protein
MALSRRADQLGGAAKFPVELPVDFPGSLHPQQDRPDLCSLHNRAGKVAIKDHWQRATLVEDGHAAEILWLRSELGESVSFRQR